MRRAKRISSLRIGSETVCELGGRQFIIDAVAPGVGGTRPPGALLEHASRSAGRTIRGGASISLRAVGPAIDLHVRRLTRDESAIESSNHGWCV